MTVAIRCGVSIVRRQLWMYHWVWRTLQRLKPRASVVVRGRIFKRASTNNVDPCLLLITRVRRQTGQRGDADTHRSIVLHVVYSDAEGTGVAIRWRQRFRHLFYGHLTLFYFPKLPPFNPLPTSSPVNQSSNPITYHFRFNKNWINTK